MCKFADTVSGKARVGCVFLLFVKLKDHLYIFTDCLARARDLWFPHDLVVKHDLQYFLNLLCVSIESFSAVKVVESD